jgi:glycosyltransferase involved in cell wall biosynthesis
MKIDILHYSVPPVVGGVESVIGYHARLMVDAGHTGRLMAGRGVQLDERIPFFHIPFADSLNSRVLDLKSILDQGRVPADFESTVEEIEHQISELTRESNFLIAHNVCSLNKNLALTAALKRLFRPGYPPQLILWHHDLAWTTPRYRDELYQGYPWNLLSHDWPGVTQVVVSKVRQAELAGLFGIAEERIHVVPNGIAASQFFKLDEFTIQLANQHQLLQANPLFLLPVRITPRKNIETALRIIHELRPRYPNIKLIVSGPPGPHNPSNLKYFSMLRSLRSELGLDQAALFLAEITSEYLPDSVIFDLYRLADALLLPSREEGFGIPLLEAGLAGMPVFCSSIPTLRELGDEAVTYFPPDGDPSSIANLIHSHLKFNHSFELKMKVRREFTWERIYQDQIAPLFSG